MPLPPERVTRLRWLFNAALLHPPAERDDFLQAACPDDPALRAEIEDLLAAEARASDGFFLDAPPVAPPSNTPPEATSPPQDDLVGETIGAHAVLRQLGRGGMGDVYLGLRSTPFRQYVALKVMRRGLDDRDLMRRFEMERQILASLNHPHIARLYDGGVTPGGRPYFVMEYVEGERITHYCDAQRLPIEARLRLFQSVCQAVHYAHQNLVLHRDLKPSNILVTHEGLPKLLDFGVAKLLNPVMTSVEVPLTRTSVRAMTPEYASPEQVRGDPLTTASDVYALGVLLYELLTGHRPYRLNRGTAQEMLRAVCEQVPERPSTRVRQPEADVPPDGSAEPATPLHVSECRAASVDQLQRRLRGDLDNIVLMALRKEPSRRYASAEQLAEDLGRFLDGRPVLAHRDSRRYRMQKFVARHRGAVLGAGAFALLLVAFSLVTALQSAQVRSFAATVAHERDRAEQALAESEEVSDFLVGLFQASDPRETLGDTVTARALLERGVARIDALAEQPAVQAQMLHVIGRIYRSLGRRDEAQRHLEHALAVRRQHWGTAHPDVAESMNSLASLLRAQGELEAAEPLFREALAMRRTLLGDAHPDVFTSMNNLALLLEEKGDVGAAEQLLRETLALRRTALGAVHPKVGVSLNNLAYLLQEQGDFDAAEALFREALAVWRQTLGDAHPDVSLSLNNLASLLQRKGDLDAAEPLFREALSIRRRVYGETHPQVATILDNLALLERARRDLDAAERLAREALAMRRQTLGTDHPAVARSLHHLALVLQERGDHEGAEQLLQEALSIQQEKLGTDHLAVAATRSAQGELFLRMGRYEEAEQHVSQALALYRERLGASHPRTARVLCQLAAVHAARRHHAAAESLYQEALAVYHNRLKEQHPWIQEAYDGLATLYEAWGRPDAAAYRARLQADARPTEWEPVPQAAPGSTRQ